MAKVIRVQLGPGQKANEVGIEETATVIVGGKSLILKRISPEDAQVRRAAEPLAERAQIQRDWRKGGKPVQRLVNFALLKAVEKVDLELFIAALDDKEDINAPVTAGKTLTKKLNFLTVFDVVTLKLEEATNALKGRPSLGNSMEPRDEGRLGREVAALKKMDGMVRNLDGLPNSEYE